MQNRSVYTRRATRCTPRRAATRDQDVDCNHTFRVTGVTAYLKHGGTLERVTQMANLASARTTQLYDRNAETVTG
jgi:integrase/recombinase XerC